MPNVTPPAPGQAKPVDRILRQLFGRPIVDEFDSGDSRPELAVEPQPHQRKLVAQEGPRLPAPQGRACHRPRAGAQHAHAKTLGRVWNYRCETFHRKNGRRPECRHYVRKRQPVRLRRRRPTGWQTHRRHRCRGKRGTRRRPRHHAPCRPPAPPAASFAGPQVADVIYLRGVYEQGNGQTANGTFFYSLDGKKFQPVPGTTTLFFSTASWKGSASGCSPMARTRVPRILILSTTIISARRKISRLPWVPEQGDTSLLCPAREI